jgi:hypothetical protein
MAFMRSILRTDCPQSLQLTSSHLLLAFHKIVRCIIPNEEGGTTSTKTKMKLPLSVDGADDRDAPRHLGTDKRSRQEESENRMPNLANASRSSISWISLAEIGG